MLRAVRVLVLRRPRSPPATRRTHLDRRIVERINLAVHEWLGCDYCLVAHTRAARRLGVPESEIQLARQGTSSDPAIAAIVAFAQQVLSAPAELGDADIERLRAHGYRDEQIAEIAGLVGLQLLTGGFNLIAGIHAPAEALAERTPPSGLSAVGSSEWPDRGPGRRTS